MRLKKRKVEPAKGSRSCVCGRDLKDAFVCVYRSQGKRHVFHRCDCGVEWTEHHTDIDLAGPVSSDEVIEVHARMASFEGPISQLLEQLIF